jgi:ubiquinone/menaquinone biosynthesis C-methylase UbiE
VTAAGGGRGALDLPYFDDLFGRSRDSPVARAFQRHVHWGYFASPDAPDVSDEGFLAAAAAMTERMALASGVRDGLRILDVGCGFGGTIAYLNERLVDCRLVGLNIDERQLVRARELTPAGRGNGVEFVAGDACAMPFGDGAFDAVLAVECVFHFPSRRTFFGEARRVLRAGGTLTVSDFVVDEARLDEMNAWIDGNASARGTFYGSSTAAISSGTYARMARAKGFDVIADDDITAATMPTYPVLRRLYGEAGIPDAVKTVGFLEEMSRRGFFQYRILSFRARTPFPAGC